MKPSLTAILITKDEEKDLRDCLDSIQNLVSEIVIVDSGSTDRTLEIARNYTTHVYPQSFKDFASQKQSALDRATKDWVLSIDADERIAPDLAEEIKQILNENPQHAAFDIPFEVYFMGRRLRHGGPGSERHIRLFHRTAGRFRGEVHEGIEIVGDVGRLQGRIQHFPYHNLDEYLLKMAHYTTVAARQRRARGERFGFRHHLLPVWEFFVRIVLRLGILDGTPGIAWAGLASYHTWIKYLKLRELERGGSHD